jgi:predicted metal-dependent phosphotriesterase family hydrolase
MRGLVRTVGGDVAPEALGVTDAHDHLLLCSPAIAGTPLDDRNAAVREARAFRDAGGRALVQWSPPGMGRQAEALPGIAEQAGILVVAATGLHQARHYAAADGVARWPAVLGAEDLVALLVEELTEGMRDDGGAPAGPGAARAGVIKVAAGYHAMDAQERRALAAAGAAHRLTGAPVCVHLELGTHGPAVLEALGEAGAPPERVVLGHLARNPDPRLHAELAAAGAYLAYDGPARRSHATDWRLGDLLAEMVEAGHGDRLLLGADTVSAEARAASGGGPGAAALLRDTAARLARQVGEEGLRAMLVENPARAFVWTQ